MGRPWLVHAVADCEQCDFHEHDYKKAVKKGREHAKKTGHTVNVETGYSQIYNPPTENPKIK